MGMIVVISLRSSRRVSREVGTDGILGGVANVPNVGGTWKALTDNVNTMATNVCRVMAVIWCTNPCLADLTSPCCREGHDGRRSR